MAERDSEFKVTPEVRAARELIQTVYWCALRVWCVKTCFVAVGVH